MMLYTDMDRQIAAVFEHGKLPSMVSINRQKAGNKTVCRPLHRHESICELLLVYEGSGIYQLEEKTYPITKGSVIFYNQGQLHELISDIDDKIGDYCIGITNLHKRGLLPNCLTAPGEPCVRQSGHLLPMFRSMCDQMFALEGTDDAGKLAAQFLCTAFIILTGQLGSSALADTGTAAEEQTALRIRSYLDRHFTEDVTLEQIAGVIGCSATYISHVFKRATGWAPIQYVIHRRIGHAQTLLISTDYSVTWIASVVGYDNSNYFSTLFSKIVGMSPMQYREFYKEEMKGMGHQL